MANVNDGTIEVRYGSLEQVETLLATTATNIVSKLNELEDQLKYMRNEGYEGVGRDAYIASSAKWDKAMDEMLAVIDGVAKNVPIASDMYRAADARGGDRLTLG